MKIQPRALVAPVVVVVILAGIVACILLGEPSLIVVISIVSAFSALILILLMKLVNEISTVKVELRETRKVVHDIAGSVGRSVPIIRAIAAHSGKGSDSSALDLQILSGEHSKETANAIENLIEKVDAMEKLEAQALHQIIGEARLMRMLFEALEVEGEREYSK